MKKSFLKIMFAALAAMAVTVSCSKDDNGGGAKVSANQIIGTWDLSYEKYIAKENNVIVDEDEYNYEEGEDFITFYEDGTVEYFDGEDFDEFEWKISGGKLYTGFDDDWDLVPITRITSAEMVLEDTESYTEGGIRYTISYKGIYQKR